MSELDVRAIKTAIDVFTMSGVAEEYTVNIPARDPNKPRTYLGWSGLGDECIKKVFFGYRKCFKPDFPPRMLRLFRRGDREEFAFIYLLRGIGFTIYEVGEDGKQFGVSNLEGNLKGHLDGVATAPEKFWFKGPAIPFLLEFKTYNKSRFAKLLKEGLKKADPKYYIQMQGYMGEEELKGGLFCAVCKDDDSLHFIWVKYNRIEYEHAVDIAQDVIEATIPPEGISKRATDYRCKLCDAHGICFKKKPSLKNCFSCKSGKPGSGGIWSCSKGKNFGTVCSKYQDIAH